MAADPGQEALSYLAGHQVMTLSTIGEEGPWAAAVFYASDNFDLYFLSAGSTRHAQNLHTNPQAAAAIHEDYDDWPEIKGIQLEGLVQQLVGKERQQAIALYEEKYTFIKGAPAHLLLALKKVNWYRLVPRRLYFIDNSKGFGHRDQVL